MKGIVFTEFLDFAELRFGMETLETIVEESELPSGGAYTSIGSYDAREMVALLATLGRITEMPGSELLINFGQHLFHRFVLAYPMFFERAPDAFDFLAKIETIIHPEVRKLYPDAELPRFECEAVGPGRMVLIYSSSRGLADLADGLIRGCAEHFGERITIHRDELGSKPGTRVKFELTRVGSSHE